ncbi:MAG: tRNA epoxyqueuosine(34) reductase QueG [Puniceicoccales bacterium]|jgi:epoxyqueuosine reductase|nr:tRNA epoxyqueuosine(34) reductase QueG [Puniceicoccales bacterium]
MNAPAISPSSIKDSLRKSADALGIDAFGVAPVTAPPRREYFLQWISRLRHGTMRWLEQNSDKRLDPASLLPGARSIIVLGMNSYRPSPPAPYRIARHALGKDYHNLLFKRLKKLCALMRIYGGEQRPCVDTAPIMEKPLAARAGLGWQGKNTLLIHREFGPWLLLGVILTTLELPPDTPANDNCRNCTRCLDACPNGAITAPYQLDASRCLAYMSIEHQGSIPVEIRPALGDRIFGCDTCLEVCPWNRYARTARETAFPLSNSLFPAPLRDTLAWNEETYNAHFAGTPFKRLGLRRWLRNACVVLGNIGTPADIPALQKMAEHPDPLLAEHAAWALGKFCA